MWFFSYFLFYLVGTVCSWWFRVWIKPSLCRRGWWESWRWYRWYFKVEASVCFRMYCNSPGRAKRSPDILANKLDVMIVWGGQWKLLLPLEAFSWLEAGGSTEAEQSTIVWSEDSWVKKPSLLKWKNHQWEEEGASDNTVPHPKGGHPTSPDDLEDPYSFNKAN